MNSKQAKRLRKTLRGDNDHTRRLEWRALKRALELEKLDAVPPSKTATPAVPYEGMRCRFDGFRNQRGQAPKYNKVPWIEKPIRQVKDTLTKMGVKLDEIPAVLKKQLRGLGRKAAPEIQMRCRSIVRA